MNERITRQGEVMENLRTRIDDLDATEGQQELNRFAHLQDQDLLAVAGGLLSIDIRRPYICTATQRHVSEDCFPA